jgi:hypothetical protein
MDEIWRDIPNYEGKYQVSNLGRVKSFCRSKEIIKTKYIDTTGYYVVSICQNNKCIPYKIHQLVAIAFLNHKPCGFNLVVDHINNDKLDNRLENLQIVTNRYNTSKDKSNKTSNYTGVCWEDSRNKWKVSMVINGKNKHLGRFSSEHEAYLAYQNKLKEL